jgi:hypothetical protein
LGMRTISARLMRCRSTFPSWKALRNSMTAARVSPTQ